MKKILYVFLVSVLFCLLIENLYNPSQAGNYFGEFGTGTSPDDTCYLCFDTYDTLGHSNNSIGDSVYYLIFNYRGAKVDSVYGATKLRNYYYCIKKKAQYGNTDTSLGQYSINFNWRPSIGKWYNSPGVYTVKPETVSYARGDTNNTNTDIGAIKTQTDKFLFDAKNRVQSEMYAVAGDTVPAYNIKKILNDDSTDAARADFKQVTMKADGTDSHGLWVKGANPDGCGFFADGPRAGAEFYSEYDWGMRVSGGEAGGLYISAPAGTEGDAVSIYSAGGKGVNIESQSTALNVQSTTNPAAYFESGNSAGIRIEGFNANSNGRVDLGGKADTSIKLGSTNNGKIGGIFNNDSLWHRVALASDSGLALVAVSGNVVDSASNSSSEFKTDLVNVVDDHYKNALIYFTSGTNAGQPPRMIIDHIGDLKYLKVSPAFEVEPTAGDDFKILYLLGREMGVVKIFEN